MLGWMNRKIVKWKIIGMERKQDEERRQQKLKGEKLRKFDGCFT
jgi:hypothetical protein